VIGNYCFKMWLVRVSKYDLPPGIGGALLSRRIMKKSGNDQVEMLRKARQLKNDYDKENENCDSSGLKSMMTNTSHTDNSRTL